MLPRADTPEADAFWSRVDAAAEYVKSMSARAAERRKPVDAMQQILDTLERYSKPPERHGADWGQDDRVRFRRGLEIAQKLAKEDYRDMDFVDVLLERLRAEKGHGPEWEIVVEAVKASYCVADRGPKLTLNVMRDEAHANSKAHGFWDKPDWNLPEKLALIHSEVSEALEAYREVGLDRVAQPFQEVVGCYVCKDPHAPNAGCETCRGAGLLNKPVGFPSELADILIRVGDLAGKLGIDLEAAVREKMAFNRLRPVKHGKVC